MAEHKSMHDVRNVRVRVEVHSYVVSESDTTQETYHTSVTYGPLYVNTTSEQDLEHVSYRGRKYRGTWSVRVSRNTEQGSPWLGEATYIPPDLTPAAVSALKGEIESAAVAAVKGLGLDVRRDLQSAARAAVVRSLKSERERALAYAHLLAEESAAVAAGKRGSEHPLTGATYPNGSRINRPDLTDVATYERIVRERAIARGGDYPNG